MRQGVFTPKLKLLWHRDRIDQWLSGSNPSPVMVELDLTNRCNLKCDFCTFDYIKDRSDIDTDAVLRMLYEFGTMGVKSINITGGGEPTLHKDFKQILVFARKMGMEIGLFTNGMNIDKDTAETIIDNCSWVRVSIDAGCSGTFQRVKRVDGFDTVVDNSKLLVETKNLKNSRCTVGIGFVITKSNYDDIELFASLIDEIGADYGQYKPEIKNCFCNEQVESAWWKTAIEYRLEDVMSKCQRAVINLYKFNDLVSHIDREYGECYGVHFVPCVGATGDVWVCTHLRNVPGYSYGNVREKSFREIWGLDNRRKVVENINLSKCQKYCRNNEINKVLWALKNNSREGHYNFI